MKNKTALTHHLAAGAQLEEHQQMMWSPSPILASKKERLVGFGSGNGNGRAGWIHVELRSGTMHNESAFAPYVYLLDSCSALRSSRSAVAFNVTLEAFRFPSWYQTFILDIAWSLDRTAESIEKRRRSIMHWPTCSKKVWIGMQILDRGHPPQKQRSLRACHMNIRLIPRGTSVNWGK
jgi:hypothetical protein